MNPSSDSGISRDEVLAMVRDIVGFPELTLDDDWAGVGVHSVVAAEALVALEEILGDIVWATAASGELSVGRLLDDHDQAARSDDVT